MVINILSIVSRCDTHADADIVYKALKSALTVHGRVKLSFAGVSSISSSFVNVALVPLLDDMTFSDIQNRVTVANIAPQAADMIKRCFNAALNKNKAA
jgi:uncharacterized protein DUF4325